MPSESSHPERLPAMRLFKQGLRMPLVRRPSGPDTAPQVLFRVVLMALLAVFGVIAYVAMASGGTISAQESATEPTGKLVVAPRPVNVGEKPVAVGFHVEPVDLEVYLEYSEHFVPDGESCTDYTAPRITTPQVAPTWATLKACSAGKGYVRLIASNSGQVIEEVSVSINAAGTRQEVRDTFIHLSNVAAQLTVGGSSDRFTVTARGLITSASYEIHVVSLNQFLAFNDGCTNHDKSTTVTGQISYGAFEDMWGCMPPGSILWAYMDSGSETYSTELDDNYVEIVCPPEGCPTPTPTPTPVLPPDNNAPTITGGPPSVTYPENDAGPVGSYTATDADGDNLMWSLGGSDSGDFSIGESTGILTFDSSPDYENPTNTGRNNVYNVTVVVTDDGSPAMSSPPLPVTVTVVNVDELGSVTLSPSNPSVDTTITATLSDRDGSVTNTSWQWQRSSNGTSGWSNISGATGSSYTVASGDGGKWLRATASYSDGHGTGKSANSSSTSQVPLANNAPTITGGPPSVTYPENDTGSVGSYTAKDTDGDNLMWSLGGSDSDDFSIGASTGILTFDSSPDYENPTDTGRNNVYNVTVVVTDDGSPSMSSKLEVTVTVVNVDELGSVTLLPSNPSVDTTITATLSDPDDNVTNTSWQWQRSSNGTSGWSNISGATGSRYTVASGDGGKWLQVTVSYRDGHGSGKSATSQSVSIAAPTPPGKVALPTLMPGDGSLDVSWSVPSSGSTQITKYNIQYKITTVSSWTSAGAVTGTSKTISGLMNGTSYHVQVQACNAPTRCGLWSNSATGTPRPTLAAPTNLDVTPLPLRKASLSWTGDTNATGYVIQAMDPKVVGREQSWNRWTSLVGNPVCEVITGQTLPTCRMEINLDNIFLDRSFADADVYRLRVKATKGGISSPYSATISIIDNPLLTSGGGAYGSSSSQATLQWRTDSGATNYTISYRQLGFYTEFLKPARDHTHVDWPRGERWPYPHQAHSETSDTPGNETIGSLDEDELYAFQINYQVGDTEVFSARDAYAWISSDFPGNGKRVATYPFFGHHENREFEYIICESDFPSAHWGTWQSLVVDAFEQWEKATNGFVTVTRDTNGQCANDDVNMATFIQDDDNQNEVRMLDVDGSHKTIYTFPEFKSDVFKICLTGEDVGACVTSFPGYSGLRTDCNVDEGHVQDVVSWGHLWLIAPYFHPLSKEHRPCPHCRTLKEGASRDDFT